MQFYRTLIVLIAPVLLTACSSTRTVRVAVPPRVDLSHYQSIGLVAFTSNANRDVERIATDRFLREVQAAQPGTRVVELGTEQEVLASVNAKQWNAKALRAVGEQRGVEVLVMGRVDLEKVKPQVSVSTMWKSLSASADVNASLTTRLVETGTGATAWTDAAEVTTNVAHADLSGRSGTFGARDPEAVYGGMMDHLVCEVTDDFREHYVYRKVPKDAVVADARD
jgi:uncharacterized lipoprotein YajG